MYNLVPPFAMISFWKFWQIIWHFLADAVQMLQTILEVVNDTFYNFL